MTINARIGEVTERIASVLRERSPTRVEQAKVA